MSIEISVLTISDSVAAGTREDHSGPAVRQCLEQAGHIVTVSGAVPDDRERIAARLRQLADTGKVAAIFTTGGTGIAPRDVTPEATRDVIEREIPGVGELMRAVGRNSVITAPLSRALGGSRGRVLIVNLPGSPRGAVESLNAIVDLVPHMVDLLNGKTEHK